MALEIGKKYKDESGCEIEIVALRNGYYIGWDAASTTVYSYDRKGLAQENFGSNLVAEEYVWVEVYRTSDGRFESLCWDSKAGAQSSVDNTTIKILKVRVDDVPK